MTATEAPVRASARRRPLLAAGAAALLATGLASLLGLATVSSDSMSPGLRADDRLLYGRALPIDRGAVVIADAWGEGLVVKRVIGVAGDIVECCEAGTGRLLVNDDPLDEPYAAGAGGSTAFEARVPEGAVWLMGDDRDASRDSRAHRTEEGGGAVPLEALRGRVLLRLP